jgi:hypothetical protein
VDETWLVAVVAEHFPCESVGKGVVAACDDLAPAASFQEVSG